MKLFEYEAKEIVRKYGLSVPDGVLITNAEQISSSIADLKAPLVLKAQILAADRMKAGGVLFASSKDEAEALSKRLLEIRIHRELVSRILIEEKVTAINELYVGISVDRENRCYLLLVSRYGGSGIEEVAARDPSKIIRRSIDPLSGLSQNDAETIGRLLGYTEDRLWKLSLVLVRLYEIVTNYDAELVEVNPLIETAAGQYVCLLYTSDAADE